MSTSLPKWEEEIRNAGSTEACLREAIRQIKGLNDMRPHDGLGYEINDVIEVANSIKGKNGNAAAHAMTLDEAIAIVRDEAKYVSPLVRDALLLVATIAEHHAERNRKNKRRQRARDANAKEAEQCES